MTPRPASLPSLLSNSPRRRLVRLQLPLPCPAPTALDHGRIRSSRHEMDSSGVEWSTFTHSIRPTDRHSLIIQPRSNSMDLSDLFHAIRSVPTVSVDHSDLPSSAWCFDRDVARLLMLSPRPSSSQPRRVSGLGRSLSRPPARPPVRAIDRHFSQTTVQRTPQAKEQKKSE